MTLPSVLGAAIALCAVAVIIHSALSDLNDRIISNASALLLAGLYGAGVLYVALPIGDILKSLMAAALTLSFGFFLFCRGLIGGGDVKMTSVIVLWTGAGHMLDLLFWATSLGGALSLYLLLFGYAGLARVGQARHKDGQTTRGVPFGVPLACASILVLPQGGLMPALLSRI